ncbi:lytic transglycosylase domain-containing protein [bacterium]|nr:lytic transglycosylase domain-containing protein [candidate division CSSED10-310 bacterium]
MQRFLNNYVIPILMLSGLLYCIPAVQADIYMYLDSNGVIHLGNNSDARKRGTLLMKETPKHRVPTAADKLEIMKMIDDTAKKHGIDPDLAKAVAQAESNFQADAVSPKGAIGVMQLMPATATRFKVKDIYHPKDNIEGGIQYLKFLLGMFPTDMTLALAAYNAGENRVLELGSIPEIKETQDYVDRVIRFYNGFKNGNTSPGTTLSRRVRKSVKSDGTIVLSNL